MIEVMRDETTGHFRIVSARAETVGIARTQAAADDFADLLLEAWEEAVAAAARPGADEARHGDRRAAVKAPRPGFPRRPDLPRMTGFSRRCPP